MKKCFVIICLLSAVALGTIAFLALNTTHKKQKEFAKSGYVLDTDTQVGSAVGNQYYFNAGETYSKNSSADTINFKTIAGDQVSVGENSYVHYSDDSMEALTKTVILDTDQASDSNMSYYSVPKRTMLEKTGNGYTVTNDGNTRSFQNIVWKISDKVYMVVSSEIALVVSEEPACVFEGYVQVNYQDSGVVLLTTQQGVYSTVSSDAYLELANGVRVYLGSKNLSTDEGVLMNLTQMLVNISDRLEDVPDMQYNNERDTEPRIVVEAANGEDGKPGAAGEDGEDGEEGEAGEAGKTGAKGADGEAGAGGNDGDAGETGKAGTAGEAGMNGTNGTNGTTGSLGAEGGGGAAGGEGDPGQAGANASTAYVVYTEDLAPEFRSLIKTSTVLVYDGNDAKEERSTCDHVLIKTVYSDRDGAVIVNDASITLTIYETLSGKQVAQKIPGTGVASAEGFYVGFDSLEPSTEYTLVISAEYQNADHATVTGDVLTQTFLTEAMGLTLSQRFVTTETFDGFVIKTSDDKIDRVRVQLYDEFRRKMDGRFLIPVNGKPGGLVGYEDKIPYSTQDETMGQFSVANLAVTDAIEVMAGEWTGEKVEVGDNGLEDNKQYYAQIEAFDENGEPLTLYNFPMVPFTTLKAAPELEAPIVTLNVAEGAFNVSAAYVKDPGNSIISYQFEVYEAKYIKETVDGLGLKIQTLDKDAVPAYSVMSNNATSIKAPVDGEHLTTNTFYRARIIARYDDNLQEAQVTSPFSTEFSQSAGSTWPTAKNEYTVISPSTVEGKVTVLDSQMTISRSVNKRLYVTIRPHEQLYTTQGTYYEEVEIASIDDLSKPEYVNNTQFDIKYDEQGLQYNTGYDLFVYADAVTIVDANGAAQTEENVLISSFSFTTEEEYIPLRINGVTGERGVQAFQEYIFFSSGAPDEDEANKTKESRIEGVVVEGMPEMAGMSHFSAKSMQSVELILSYKGVAYGTMKLARPSDYAEGQNAQDYRFVKNNKDPLKNETEKSLSYSRYVTFDTTDPAAYTAAKKAEILTQCKAGEFGIPITIEAFTSKSTGKPLEVKEINYDKNTERYLNVTAVVYDYTYMTSGAKRIGWTDSKGTILNNIECLGSYDFELGVEGPQFDVISDTEHNFSYQEIQKKDLKKEVAVGVTRLQAYQLPSTDPNFIPSNFTAQRNTNIWQKDTMDSTTAVGVRIQGPAEGLKQYAYRVKYTVYDENAIEVANSGYLDVVQASSSKELPAWDFFMDTAYSDGAGGTLVLKRGDEFTVRTQIIMNTYFAQTCEIPGTDPVVTVDFTKPDTDPVYYPDDFREGAKYYQLFQNPDPLKDIGADEHIDWVYTINKQAPSIKLVQWDGQKMLASVAEIGGVETKLYSDTVTYLAKIVDIDEALDAVIDATHRYDDYEDENDCKNIRLYYGDTPITPVVKNNGATPVGDGQFGYLLKDVSFASDPATGTISKLSFRYFLTEADRNASTPKPAVVPEPYLDTNHETLKSGKTVQLVTKTNAAGLGLDAADLTYMYGAASPASYLIVDNKDSAGTGKNGLLNIRFWYKGDSPDQSKNDIGRVEMTVVGYDLKDDGVTRKNVVTVNMAFSAEEFAAGTNEYKKTVGTEEVIFYRGTLSVNSLDPADPNSAAISAVCGSKYIESSMIAFYDSGHYGLKYVQNNGYYSTQKQGSTDYSYMGDAKTSLFNAVYRSRTDTDPSVKFSDSSDRVEVFYETDTVGSRTYEYTQSGLSYVTRNVASLHLADGVDKRTNPLAEVLPDYYSDVNPGYSEARFQLHLAALGTLIQDSGDMLTVFVAEKGTPISDNYADNASLTKILLNNNASSAQYYSKEQVISGLKGGTDYHFRVFGKTLDTGVETWKPLTNIGASGTLDLDEVAFTTITRIDVDNNMSEDPKYLSEVSGSNDKSIELVYTVTNMFYSDISNSLESITMLLSTNGAAAVSCPTEENILQEMKDSFPKDGSTPKAGKQTYDFTVTVPWKPGAAHVMNGTVKYTFQLSINYKSTTGGEKDESVKRDLLPSLWTSYRNRYPDPVSSKNRNGDSYIGLKAYTGVAAGSAANRGTFALSITGVDKLRLFRMANASGAITHTGDGTDKLSFTVKLYHRTDAGGEEFVAQKEFSGIDVSEKDGTLTRILKSQCEFTGLKHGHYYKARLMMAWDTDNDGMISDAAGENRLYETLWWKIPLTQMSIDENGVVLDPANGVARISGYNLDYADMIYYELTVNGGDPVTRLIKKSDNEAYWSSIWGKVAKQEYYNLKIPELNNAEYSYELLIKLSNNDASFTSGAEGQGKYGD